jgi:hypothetical protein
VYTRTGFKARDEPSVHRLAPSFETSPSVHRLVPSSETTPNTGSSLAPKPVLIQARPQTLVRPDAHFFLTNVSPFMYSNFLAYLMSSEVPANEGPVTHL